MSYGGRGPLLLGVSWAEAAVALILVALRAKTASLCPPGHLLSTGIFGLRWDFCWVIFALGLALSAQILMTVSARFGLGNHEHVLSDADKIQTNFWSWMAQVLAIIAMAVGRIAVIAFLLTLQARTNVTGRWLLYVVGAAQGLINLGEAVLILRQCDPIAKLWDHNVPGTCDLIVLCSQVGFAQGSIGAAADVFLAFYPIYIIGSLQHMKLRLKIGLCLIMSGGVIAGIAGINKTVAIATITQTQDITYAIAKLNTWVLTEMWFIIIFGSIPVLRPFFVRFSQSIKATTGSARSKERTSRSTKTSRSREQGDEWMQLYDRAGPQGSGRDPSLTSQDTDDHGRRGEDEQRLTNRASSGAIVVTKDVSVTLVIHCPQRHCIMSIQEQVERLQALAAQDAAGNATAHANLLKGIRALQLSVETPIETASRLNFQTLVARDGQPVTASELAAESGADELLINYMRGPGIHQFADEPGEVTLFQYAHGTKSIFGLLEKNEEQKKSFDDYMASRRLVDAPQWFEIFPAADRLGNVQSNDDVLLVDVGGGPGQELGRFKERHPEVLGRLVLQDLPLTLRRIEKLPEGVESMEYDFFTPQPVKGARAYFLRDVLHNWSDAQGEKILSRIVEAMDPEYSTLLIDDYVLPDTGAELRAAEMDILMWLHTSGLERTVSQWKALFAKVGLELVQIWSADRGNESVIEARRVRK
ncbi:S-adenosyl-L-methionine-dependent methyltransferase [Purpureocillium lavendulum]|uniref:S-adenosyl-L-methionine-dependent methyltransferase n=1 Tax=Purpureocillium lavendulum TaxID=1247861 RepID=A0AB34G5C5_9HYPO|nr:S-adenosyl-L-methionine-dependent methyltransferase [Purpureocillium lavendulum]